MALVENQGTKIYWDEQGQGAPVLLIMGLGYTSAMWYRTRPVLAQQYRTIAFDNRGVGLSDLPLGLCSIATMAADAAAVLDAAGVARAHVFGVSMGGMIAQEFALQYPARTRSLILGCTSPGGPSAVLAESKVADELMARGMTLEQAREAILPYIYDAATPREKIDEDTRVRQRWLPSPAGYMAQLLAIVAWEGYSRIAQITAPTLVIHGKSDALVPAGKWGADRSADSRRKTRPARARESLVCHRPNPSGAQRNTQISFVACWRRAGPESRQVMSRSFHG